MSSRRWAFAAIGISIFACSSEKSQRPGGNAGSAGAGASSGATSSGGTAGASGRGAGGQGGSAGTAGDAGPGGSGACSTSAFEPNGVRQIYPTACGKAEPWVLGFDDWSVRTRQWGTLSGSGAQTTVTASGQVRLTVKAEDSDCEGETDQGKALAQGYMCSPNDWLNYELTAYLRLDLAAPAETEWDFTLYGNGGRHTGSGPPTGCMGSSYKGSYDYKQARVRFGKESWHVNYDYRPWIDVPNGVDLTQNPNAWLGLKVVRYEFSRNAQKGVRNELWLDLAGIDAAGKPTNDWKLIRVDEDHPESPSWGSQATDCGVPVDNQIMFWAGPWLTFRWDDTTATARLMSAREIVPPAAPPPP
jgi:hypothetical protein